MLASDKLFMGKLRFHEILELGTSDTDRATGRGDERAAGRSLGFHARHACGRRPKIPLSCGDVVRHVPAELFPRDYLVLTSDGLEAAEIVAAIESPEGGRINLGHSDMEVCPSFLDVSDDKARVMAMASPSGILP